MNKKNYIDKIELILNTSGKYITRKERDMILDYANYFKTKNNVIEDKNIELVIEIERLNNIRQQVIDELFDLKNMIYKPETRETNFDVQNKISSIIKILGSDKE